VFLLIKLFFLKEKFGRKVWLAYFVGFIKGYAESGPLHDFERRYPYGSPREIRIVCSYSQNIPISHGVNTKAKSME
jgi:hypothetical protein